MKKIVKGIEPVVFSSWKMKKNDDWQPSYEVLQNPEKQALHLALIFEQNSVCCYCGRKISLANSHIEHFRPQEKFDDLALVYNNLHASCIRETKPGAPLHCGHAKENELDENKLISPLEKDCEQRFIYSTQDGSIYPAERSDLPAGYMIDLLKLNVPFLSSRRAEAIKNVFDDDFLNSANNEEIEKIVQYFRTVDSEGNLDDFGHVISRYGEQIINYKTS